MSKALPVNALLGSCLLVLAMASLSIGPMPLSLAETARALLFGSDGSAAELLQRQHIIVSEIRLPRVLLALLVGASLGMSGAALQGLLRNPLAEPGLLGISSSASFGAVLCLYFGLANFSPWLLPASAMGCATLATLVLYRIARGSRSNLSLILAGVALSSLAGALTSLAINLAPNPTDVQDIVLWLLGSLADRSFDDIRLCLPFIVVGLALLAGCGRELDALATGEEEAASLGVNLARLRTRIVLGTALSVGASVAVTGAIGFVGLVVPHMLRRAVGYHPARLLWASALGGGLLLLAADIILRLFSGGFELMLGVVTALIGAPFFFYLVVHERLEQG